MPPKSSSSSTSKKKAAGASDTTAVKKFKLPKEFIARPHKNNDTKELATIIVHSKVLKELEIHVGSMCIVSKLGSEGTVGIAKAGDENNHPVDVIMISRAIRSVANIILGDRLEIKKVTDQPTYSSTVTVGCVNKNLREVNYDEKIIKKAIGKVLNDCGVISPGMVFEKVQIEDGENPESIDLIIIDLNEEELPDIGSLSINDTNSELYESFDYLSPAGIFKTGQTKILISERMNVNYSKYNLPERNSYENIGGLKSEMELIKNTIELPLNKPELFKNFGINPPKGILLHGPPGTGKTLILRSIADSSDAHVLTINGPSIVSKYLGETEEKLREYFNEAKRYEPCIIFIDEIDSLAPSRSSDDSGEIESRVVATLLTLMDGYGGNNRVIVIGATNRINNIDGALRRPGRFDQEIEIGVPDVNARKDILLKQFNKMSKNRHTLSDEDIESIASKTHGYVGADLSGLCREAVMKAIQRGLKNIKDDDIKVELNDLELAMIDIRPSGMREIFLEMPKVYWKDIGGQEDTKQKIKEMIELPLQAGESFKRLGISVPRGVLLYGPPGCSKTLMAKALATESGINFFAVKGPEIFNKYVGESERSIREVFRKARLASPSIIFFDEIDAISNNRDNGSSSVSNHVLTTLLNEIDGVEELKGVIIVGATNRPDEIDSALLRPGRLDRHLYVGPPDFEGRYEIIRNCTKNFNITDDSFLKRLSEQTEGCSGAEVVLLCQEAGLAAITEDQECDTVDQKYFTTALQGLSKGITTEMLEYYDEFASRSGVSV